MQSCSSISKAFDIIYHDILLTKLNLYGFQLKTLAWVANYLSNRTQKTQVQGVLSDSSTVKCGIPQGSILDHLFFLLYINDLPNCVFSSRVRRYADDTNLTYASTDQSKISNMLNGDLETIPEWLKANKLSLNVTKTKMVFPDKRSARTQWTQPHSSMLASPWQRSFIGTKFTKYRTHCSNSQNFCDHRAQRFWQLLTFLCEPKLE